MNILLICGNGVSSGMFGQKIRHAAMEEGYKDFTVEAYSYSQLREVVSQFDAVLVAPQLKFSEKMIRSTCEEFGKPYEIIDTMAYSLLDGKKGLNQIKHMLNC